MITRATVQQFNQFVNAGILPALCNLLSLNLKCTPLEQTNIINALTGLTKILHAAEEIGLVKKLVIMIKKIGGLDKIEALQHHNNDKIYKKSLIIINAFFSVKVCIVTFICLFMSKTIYIEKLYFFRFFLKDF